MPVKATLRHLHIAPRKAKLVIDLIRGLDVIDAENQLRFLNKKSSDLVLKLLLSATSNAINNFNMEKDNLFISKTFVNEAPTLKRFRPRAFGRAYTIRRRTSHIEIELEEKIKGKKAKKVKKQEVKAEEKQEKKVKTEKKWGKNNDQKRGLFGRKSGGGNKIFQRKAM
ncbi:MAG: 50S ribosomal protein L22 [Patescibacteria group bacterium]|jgi:large subunit ribosomal protein L22